MNDSELIRINEVCRMLGGVSRSTVYNWTQQRRFPRGIHIGDNTVAWKRGTVREFIDSRTNLAA